MPLDAPALRRCAIYTRKSSDEGLDQAFNSLDAQYEACAAYIASQIHEGWTVVDSRYDDGGISGGTMERPGLKRLLADIEAGRVDVIVVYKVDRLTRSLGDFARMVDVFDKHEVSFVSITQQFNTTSSMGRLTLNVLLSFAQFEREVTGERIRDKIAASKKKGMWMGGHVPLGYDVVDRKLVINAQEAESVRTLFQLYLEKGNVREVVEETKRRGILTKTRITQAGNTSGGKMFGRGPLYWLLKNPVYMGLIRHGDKTWPGKHDAIVDQKTWDDVQARLASNRANRRSRTDARAPSLLVGLLYDKEGHSYTPSHAVKNGRRYRYYVERNLNECKTASGHRGRQRLPAHEIEALVIHAVAGTLGDTEQLFAILALSTESPNTIDLAITSAGQLAHDLENGTPSRRLEIIGGIVKTVTMGDGGVAIEIDLNGLRSTLGISAIHTGKPTHTITVPVVIRTRGVEMKLIMTGPQAGGGAQDPVLIKAVVRANDWWDRLMTGKVRSISALARDEGYNDRYVARHLTLAFLDPGITQAILDGRQPPDLSLETVMKGAQVPMNWADQRQALGFELT